MITPVWVVDGTLRSKLSKVRSNAREQQVRGDVMDEQKQLTFATPSPDDDTRFLRPSCATAFLAGDCALNEKRRETGAVPQEDPEEKEARSSQSTESTETLNTAERRR